VTVRFAALPPILFKVRRIYCCVLKTTDVTVIIALRERPKRFMLAVSNRELKYNMIPPPFLVVSSLHYIIIHLITLISHF
jgi:hypothetical protein